MPAYLSPIGNDQQADANGVPVSGALIATYVAGTTTPVVTYSDAAGTSPQANPVVCNAAGFPANPIFLPAGVAVKMVFTTSVATGSVPYRPAVDNIQGVNDPSFATTVSEWTAYSGTPTFINATSFSVTGDQTNTFQIGRRVKTTNTGGTVYSTIASSSFASTITTVTLVNDSGTLDAGLSAVSYGLLAPSNPSVPQIYRSPARVSGLIGINNTTTPLTKFDLSADAVSLRNSLGNTVTSYNTATLTCDLGLAGPAANGRDQAGAFTANSWVYLYFIWNGTTLATLASATVPTSFTNATLPSGYTHWAFATAVRWNGSSNLPVCRARGSKVFYATPTVVLSGGTAVVDTSVSTATAVPPNALVTFADLLFNNAPTASAQTAVVRLVSGSTYSSLDVAANGIGNFAAQIPNLSQSFLYTLTVATSPFSVKVTGYAIPNGDS